mmetsp:Transcript_6204/g.5793  ORF Transcript_6204/g.5793 Transcript_6204/m.5793 type:complete len:114 (-) Transcript_6204:25-366(-)
MLILNTKENPKTKTISRKFKPLLRTEIRSMSPKKDMKNLKYTKAKKLRLKRIKRHKIIQNYNKEIRSISSKLGKFSRKHNSFKIQNKRRTKRLFSPKPYTRPLEDLLADRFLK